VGFEGRTCLRPLDTKIGYVRPSLVRPANLRWPDGEAGGKFAGSPPMTDQNAPSTGLPEAKDATSDSQSPRDTWLSEELLGQRTEILIKHGSETYRLRRTRQDKLILYK
jgi:hemin uptake protein HemP